MIKKERRHKLPILGMKKGKLMILQIIKNIMREYYE